MSAKDLFHDAVRRGLEKDHWQITDDPLELEWEEVKVKIDLAAERLIAAERDQQKIAVEIKSFISTSAISDFHTALGQFLNYRIMLLMLRRSLKRFQRLPFQVRLLQSLDI
jgi:hypothetical protein